MRMKVIHLYLLILLICNTLFAVTQDIKFERITVAQGLSHSAVYSIVQDREGFLWFGTESGLNRYDGYDFKVFTHIPGDINSLSSHFARVLHVDRSGTLWVGTREGGLHKYDREKETFTCYKIAPGSENSVESIKIRAIHEDRAGFIWVGTDRGLFKFDREKETFTSYTINSQNKKIRGQNIIYAICEGRTGFLWVGTAAGLYKFDREKKNFTCFKEGAVQSIYKDDSGVMWVGTTNGLNRYDREKDVLMPYSTGNKTGIYAIYKDESGVLWAGTDEGLCRFDRGMEDFTCDKEDPRDAYSLSSNFILSIYEDRAGMIWVGTRAGLNAFKRERKSFNLFRHIPSDSNSLSHNFVWSIIEDSSGILWIGTDDGLNRYDYRTNLFTCYKHEPGNVRSLSHSCIYSINEGPAGNIWVGTANGLDKFDREKGVLARYNRGEDSSKNLSGSVIMRIFTGSSGSLWVGTFHGGLNKFDPHREVFTHYKHDPRTPGTISDNTITSIYEDRSGAIWIGTHGGLNKFDREKEVFTCYQNDPRNPNSLGSNKIASIYEDRSGVMWLGTPGGLSRFDRETGFFTTFAGNYGLPQVISGILEDEHGILWLSSNKGIFKFNPKDGKVKSYDISDGLQDYHFNEGAFFKSKSGEMFFGGVKGFNAFFPDEIKDSSFVPPVVITSFKVFNRDYKLEKSIVQTRALTLSYDDSFSFEFAALCFSDPENNEYAYKLEGLHRDWIELGKKREITFSNLAPRTYTLKVKGRSSDGVWNEKGKELKITIIPPFWQTLWFILLLLSTVSGLLVFFIRLRINRIKEKAKVEQMQLKQEMEKKRFENELQLKADFTAMLGHDLRTPLSAVIGFSGLMEETTDLKKVKKYSQLIHLSTQKMLLLINDMLDLSKFEAGKMVLEKRESLLWAVIDETLKIMSPLFTMKKINLIFDIPPAMREITILIDPEKMGQVLNNLLSNAVKYVKEAKGVITLQVCETADRMVEVSVKDNGPGIPLDRQKYLFERYAQFRGERKVEGTGLGLVISKLIVEAHGGTIGYRDVPEGSGSIFFFRLPI